LVEFAPADEVRRLYPDGPRRLVDGGRWDLLAGQPTDDGEMALALARAIVESGRYDPVAALQAYRDWLASSPFDVGNTIAAALRGSPKADSEANGSLMRASPLGLLAHRRPAAAAAELARIDSALTHPHPVCGDATAAFVVAVAHAVERGDGPEGAYGAARDWAEATGAAAPARDALARAEREAPRCDGASSRCRTRSTSCCTHPESKRESSPPSAAAAIATPTPPSPARCWAPRMAGSRSRRNGARWC